MSNGHYFISYARLGGGNFALRLYESLTTARINIWLDINGISSGANWDFEIDKALNSADGVLVVLTADALLSHQVKSEWNRALNRNRLIIPLLFENIEIPRVLELFNYISFIDKPFEESLSTLVKRLSTGIGAHLDYLKTRRNAYAELQKKNPHFQHKIDDLNEAIEAYDGRVEAQQTRISQWKSQRLHLAPVVEQKTQTLTKVVGKPPREVTDFFKDRLEERKKLIQLLADAKTRLVTIIGRGGIGKTQIALKILQQLEQGQWPYVDDKYPVEGILYISQQNNPISLERIFLSLTKLMDSEREITFRRIWNSGNRSTTEKINLLLQGFGSGLNILLLDNAEELLDARGEFRDADLQLFIERLLGERHNMCAIVTSREPIALRRDFLPYGRTVLVEQGLPVEDAVQLLRDQDPDGLYNIRNLPEKELARVARLVHGVPRALEVAAGILIDNPEESVDDLEKQFFQREEVVNEVIEEGYKRLDDEARRYMEALSVFRRTIPNVAVDFVLEPFFSGLNTPLIRRRLARMNLINTERGSDEVSLHQIDMDFAYSQLPEEGDYCRRALELRAAEFYEEFKVPINDWHTVHDVDAYIFQFDHLMKAAAYDKAGQVLGECSISLAWRGYSSDALAMHQRLEGKITDPQLLAILARGLANVYTVRGPLPKAIKLFEKALEWAKGSGSDSLAGDVYLDFGVAYRYSGDLESAKSVFRKSLAINRNNPGEYDRSQILHQLARVCIYQGATKEGLKHASEALDRDLTLKRTLFQGIDHSVIALAHLVAQNYDLVIKHATQSLNMLSETRDSSQGWTLNTLGLAYLAQNDINKAQHYLDQAYSQSVSNEQPRLQGFSLFNLAWCKRKQNEIAQALNTLEETKDLFKELGAPEIDAVYAFIEAIEFSLEKNVQLEIKCLLKCAKAIDHNPDLYPAGKVVSAALEIADTEGLTDLAAEARRRLEQFNLRSSN